MLNWTQLTAQGRARDIGIPWTEEEQVALVELINHTGLERAEIARFVRDGITSIEAYDATIKSGKKPVSRADLEEKAKDAGISFDPVTPDSVLEKATAKQKSKK